MDNKSIYQFDIKNINGEDINLSAYKGKVLLIVNTASQCGFTPQLKDLAALKNEFKDSDFEILGLPSNDFGGQEPLEGEAIAVFCENYGSNFPVFDKIRVRGPYAHPLYKFLSEKKENGKFTLTVQIPANTTAIIYLPAHKGGKITEGGKNIASISTIKFLGYADGKAMVKTGSGTYHFVSDL